MTVYMAHNLMCSEMYTNTCVNDGFGIQMNLVWWWCRCLSIGGHCKHSSHCCLGWQTPDNLVLFDKKLWGQCQGLPAVVQVSVETALGWRFAQVISDAVPTLPFQHGSKLEWWLSPSLLLLPPFPFFCLVCSELPDRLVWCLLQNNFRRLRLSLYSSYRVVLRAVSNSSPCKMIALIVIVY